MIQNDREAGFSAVLPAFVAILTLGSALRFLYLGQQPFHVDEAYSLWFATRSWQYLWEVVPRLDTHPSLFYSILKLWLALGSSEWHLRLPSTLISIATLPVVFIAARQVGGPRNGRIVGLVAMLVCAVVTFQVDRAQEGRSYAFWFFAMALSVGALAWLVRNPETACLPLKRWIRLPKAVAAFGSLAVGLSLLVWFHNIGAIYTASIAVFCVAWWMIHLQSDRHAFFNLLLVAAVALLLYAPNLPILFHQIGRASDAEFYMAEAPSLGEFFYKVINAVGITPYTPLRVRYLLLLNVPLAIAAVAGTVALLRRDRGAFALLLLSLTLVPVALIMLVTYTIKSILQTPLAGPIALPWYILLASSVLLFRGWKIPAAIAVTVSAVYATSLPGYYLDPIRKEPWNRIAGLMAQESTGSGIVITVPNEAALPLDYYVRKRHRNLRVVALPGPYPFRGLPPFKTPLGGGSAGIDDYAIDVLRQTVAAQDPEWLVVRALVWYDPRNLVRQFLARRYCLTRYRLGMYGYIELFRLSARNEAAPGACEAVRVVKAPICHKAVTRVARSPIGCIGGSSGRSGCFGTLIQCRLEYE